MRYAIMVREFKSDHLTKLCEVATNPEAIAEAARKKTLLMDLSGSKKKTRVPKYEHVDIQEIET